MSYDLAYIVKGILGMFYLTKGLGWIRWAPVVSCTENYLFVRDYRERRDAREDKDFPPSLADPFSYFCRKSKNCPGGLPNIKLYLFICP